MPTSTTYPATLHVVASCPATLHVDVASRTSWGHLRPSHPFTPWHPIRVRFKLDWIEIGLSNSLNIAEYIHWVMMMVEF